MKLLLLFIYIFIYIIVISHHTDELGMESMNWCINVHVILQ